MKIEILEKEIEISEETKKYIETKILSLQNLLPNDEDNFCDFRIGKNSGSHKKGKIYFAEASIKTSQKNYGARSESENLNEAIDTLKDELAKKIRRYKGKKISMMKKGGRLVKNFLRKIKK
jgi:ribosomal subunit interface protein